MQAKVATLGLLKIKVFWNKDNDIIISVYGVINKNLSLESSYIVDVVIWPRFGNSSTSMREVIISSILQGSGQKNHFFWGVVLVCTNCGLEICEKSGKRVITKKQKVLGFNSYVCRSYRGKTSRGGLFAPLPCPELG